MTKPKLSTELPTIYRPNSSQLERVAALRRFNWYYVYIPTLVLTIGLLVLVGLLLFGVFSPGITGTAAFASAVADIIIILTVLPMLLLCALVPLAAIGLYAYQQQQPKREYGRLQPLFWRLDSLLNTVQYHIKNTQPKIARPIISLNAQLVYLESWLKEVRRIITRS